MVLYPLQFMPHNFGIPFHLLSILHLPLPSFADDLKHIWLLWRLKMKLIYLLIGKSAFEHVHGKEAIAVKYIIIIIYASYTNLFLDFSDDSISFNYIGKKYSILIFILKVKNTK